MNEILIDKELDEIAKVSQTGFESKYEPVLLKLKTESEKLKYDVGILRSGDYLMAIYLGKGDNQKTIDLANKLKKITVGKRDTYGYISGIYRKSGLALGYLGLNDICLKDFRKAISYAEEIENNDRKRKLLSFAYENINVYYENKGEERGANDSMFINYQKSLEMAKMISDKNDEVPIDQKYDLIAFGSMCLGRFYLDHEAIKGYLDFAEKYLLDAQKIYDNKKYNIDPTNKAQTFNELSRLYIETKEYQKAINYAGNALEFENQHKYPLIRKQSYQYLLKAFLATGNIGKAKFYQEKYIALEDSLNYVNRQAANLSMKKMVTESDYKHMKSSKKQWIVISALVFVIGIIVFIVWRKSTKILHRKYENMIENLKNVDGTQLRELSGIIAKSNKDLRISVNKNITPVDTETKILKQLEEFEKSENFLEKDMTISSLAIQLNTNTRYLSEIINNHKAQTFSNYINNLRINYITYKLYNEEKYKEYKISYLAEECGFSSSQVFVRAFKKMYGLTPSYFIRNLQKGQINVF